MADENSVRRRNIGNGGIKSGDAPDEQAPTVLSAQQEINLQQIRDKARRLQGDVLEGLETQLQELVDDFVQEVETLHHNGIPTAPRAANGSVSEHAGFVKRRRKGELPDKEFISRRSVLTELLEISHIRTIYNIFVAMLIVFSLNTIAYDAIDKGRLALDFKLIIWTFGGLPMVTTLWCCMFLSTVLVVYPLFNFWAANRRPGSVYWLDWFWLVLYISYQTAFLIIPVQVLTDSELPPASSVIVVTEQTRMLMKAHAFVRENIPRVMKITPPGEGDGEGKNKCPHFSSYLYFLFAPTLVYRDDYPRTAQPVRWHYVVSNFVQVLACLFYTYYIFERFCVPVFRDFGREKFSAKRLILAVFGSMMPGTLVLFIAFFAILHSWLNAFAEMLRFADRLFYKDWWNSSSFSNYYRTWNVVVHDWLYSYVYKDICKVFGSQSRPLAMSAVFLLSAVFHEYIITVSFRFFYPVLFVMFAGAGFAFIFIPDKGAPRSGNVFMWVALFIGNGLLMCLYSMEWYARLNCPSKPASYLDFFTARSWTCDYGNLTEASPLPAPST